MILWLYEYRRRIGYDGSKEKEHTIGAYSRGGVFDKYAVAADINCAFGNTFIKSLCHLNLLMTKALKDSDLDGYTKANSEYAKTFKLSATSYTYSGGAKKPSVKIYDSDGKLIDTKNYTITYKNNKNVGRRVCWTRCRHESSYSCIWPG